MRFIYRGLLAPVVFALASCGGGGDVAGDVATFSVLPSSSTLDATCPGGGVENRISIHTINGGKPPFRVRSQTKFIEVGLVNSDREFVEPSPSMLVNGDMVLAGKDPQFALRSTLGCGSAPLVLVLDYFSKIASVTLTVAQLEE